MLTPFPVLDIEASPDMIAKGLITYADPAHAISHIYSVISDGMTLGFFWLLVRASLKSLLACRSLSSSYDPCPRHALPFISSRTRARTTTMQAVMWGNAEAVSIDSTRSYTLASLHTFRSWLTLSNVRLLMLLLHVSRLFV